METRVLIAHSSAPAAAGIGESFSVPDRNGKQSQAYLWAGGCLQEVNRFKQKQSSWFVGGGVVSDGGVYMATPVDPIFVLLPVLERSRAKTASSSGMFCPLEQILSDPISPALHVLLNGGGGGGGEGEEVQGSAPSTTPISELLLSVCEVKDAGGDKYYRVSDEMVLAWLVCKVGRVKTALQNLLQGMDTTSQDAYAVAFLAEYISDTWRGALASHLEIDSSCYEDRNVSARPTPDKENLPVEKRVKVEDPKVVTAKKAEEGRLKAKQERMAKDAVGSKKISAFFGKAAAKKA